MFDLRNLKHVTAIRKNHSVSEGCHKNSSYRETPSNITKEMSIELLVD